MVESSKLPYFFGYKTAFFSFQINPKDLDLSYMTDLYLWDCFGRVKLIYCIAKFDGTVICSPSREEKTLPYSQINTVNIHKIYNVNPPMGQTHDGIRQKLKSHSSLSRTEVLQ